jgi:hypothetical protein
MPRDFQARVVLAGLARLGRPGSLGGVDCGFVHIERDADMAPGSYDTAYDNHVVRVIVATIAASYGSRTGQTLTVPGEGTFKLDRLLQDTGVTRRHIAVPVVL